MSKKLRPLAENILVKRFKNESITSGGIHVPETSQGKTQTGSIVALGEGKLLNDGTVRPPAVSVGDVIVFGKYAGTDVDLGGEELLMLKESDILGVIESSQA